MISYKEVTLGSGTTSQKLQFAIPPSLASSRNSNHVAELTALTLKANIHTISAYADKYSISEMLSVFRPDFTTSTTMVENEASDVANSVAVAFLNPDIANLQTQAFYDQEGVRTNMHPVVARRFDVERKPIMSAHVQSILNLHDVDERLPSKKYTMMYVVSLPQKGPSPVVRRLFDGEDGDNNNNNDNNGNADNEDDDDDDDVSVAADGQQRADPRRAAVPPSVRRAIAFDDPGDVGRPMFTYTGPITLFASLPDTIAVLGELEDQQIFSVQSFVNFQALTPTECFSKAVSFAAWHIAKFTLWQDIVGTHSDIAELSTHQVQDLLVSTAGCSFTNDRNQLCTRQPAESFSIYNSIVTLLPPDDIAHWGFTIPQLFLQGLPREIREALNEQSANAAYSYKLPSHADLNTMPKQMHQLRIIRNYAQEAYAYFERQKQTIQTLIQSSLRLPPPRPNGPPPPPPADSYAGYLSPAEGVLRQANETPPGPLCDPETGYCSVFPPEFRGCFGCGNAKHPSEEGGHSFKDCPQKKDPAVIKKFHLELHARIPSQRERRAARRATAGLPPPEANKKPKSGDGSFSGGSSIFTYHASPSRVFAGTGQVVRPMPINVDNNLPHVLFQLCQAIAKDCKTTTDKVIFELLCMVDSGASLSTGQTDVHEALMAAFPSMVKEYVKCDGDHPFQALCLHGILKESDHSSKCSFDTVNNRLDSVVTYWTKYRDSTNHNQVAISFALGKNVSVPTIIGCPTIRALECVLDFGAKLPHMLCARLDVTFPLIFQAIVPPSIVRQAPSTAPVAVAVSDSLGGSPTTVQHDNTSSSTGQNETQPTVIVPRDTTNSTTAHHDTTSVSTEHVESASSDPLLHGTSNVTVGAISNQASSLAVSSPSDMLHRHQMAVAFSDLSDTGSVSSPLSPPVYPFSQKHAIMSSGSTSSTTTETLASPRAPASPSMLFPASTSQSSSNTVLASPGVSSTTNRKSVMFDSVSSLLSNFSPDSNLASPSTNIASTFPERSDSTVHNAIMFDSTMSPSPPTEDVTMTTATLDSVVASTNAVPSPPTEDVTMTTVNLDTSFTSTTVTTAHLDTVLVSTNAMPSPPTEDVTMATVTLGTVLASTDAMPPPPNVLVSTSNEMQDSQHSRNSSHSSMPPLIKRTECDSEDEDEAITAVIAATTRMNGDFIFDSGAGRAITISPAATANDCVSVTFTSIDHAQKPSRSVPVILNDNASAVASLNQAITWFGNDSTLLHSSDGTTLPNHAPLDNTSDSIIHSTYHRHRNQRNEHVPFPVNDTASTVSSTPPDSQHSPQPSLVVVSSPANGIVSPMPPTSVPNRAVTNEVASVSSNIVHHGHATVYASDVVSRPKSRYVPNFTTDYIDDTVIYYGPRTQDFP